jgi:hypothetical protein
MNVLQLVATAGGFGDYAKPKSIRIVRVEQGQAVSLRFDYEEAHVQAQPMKFACPSVVLREGETNSGATEIFHPWADAVAQA